MAHKRHAPYARSLGTFREARSRCEQPGWTAARTSAGPHSGPQTSPRRREAGRREQAERDISGARESTSSAGTRPGDLVAAKSVLLRFHLSVKTACAPLRLLSPQKPLRWVFAGTPGVCRDETRRPSPFRAPGRNRKPARRYGNRQKKETARALLCAGSCHRGSSTW